MATITGSTCLFSRKHCRLLCLCHGYLFLWEMAAMLLLAPAVARHAVARVAVVAVVAVGGDCPHTEKSLWKEEDVSQ